MIAFSSPLSAQLPAIVDEYIDAKDLCPKQQERLRLHVRCFDAWRLNRPAPDEFSGEAARVSAWLADLAGQFSPATVNGYRQSVIGLLKFATPDGDPLPRVDRIRRQKQPDKINPALTHAELRLLLAAAPYYRPLSRRVYGRGTKRDEVVRHRPDGVPWSVWWEAFIRVGYDSGQYLSDLRGIPWANVHADGSASFVRHKTGKAMSFRLSAAAIEAARRLGHQTLLLPWDFDMAAYFSREWRRFLRSVDGVRDLEPKALRRSAITYTYIDQGEEAARILAGHSSFATTAKHYIDWSIARRPIVSPPAI